MESRKRRRTLHFERDLNSSPLMTHSDRLVHNVYDRSGRDAYESSILSDAPFLKSYESIQSKSDHSQTFDASTRIKKASNRSISWSNAINKGYPYGHSGILGTHNPAIPLAVKKLDIPTEATNFAWTPGRRLNGRQCALNMFIDKQLPNEFNPDFKQIKPGEKNKDGSPKLHERPQLETGTYRAKGQVETILRLISSISDSWRPFDFCWITGWIDHLCPETLQGLISHPFITPPEPTVTRRALQMLNVIPQDHLSFYTHLQFLPFFVAMPRGRQSKEEMTIQHMYDLSGGGGGGSIATANDRKAPGKKKKK